MTVGTDSVTAPATGSLRQILGVAKPGDTIRFASPFVIVLDPRDSILRIDSTMTGLTIEGPAEIRSGKVNVTGDAITITGMRFTDAFVEAGDPRDLSSVTGLRTDDFVFRGNTLAGASRLELVVLRNARVEGNTFDVRNPGGSTAVSDGFSEGSRWTGNTWTDTSLGGFAEDDCTDFVFEAGNKVVGDARFATRSGLIAGNEFAGAVAVTESDLDPVGPVTLTGNTCRSIRTMRADIVVSGNTVSGVSGLTAKLLAKRAALEVTMPKTGAGGFLHVLANTVTAPQGWGAGLAVGGTTKTTELRAESNTVTGAVPRGLHVITSKAATVSRNTVNGNGVGKAGGGIVISGAAVGGVTVEGNTVTGATAAGINLLGGSGDVTLRDSTVTGCTGAALTAARDFISENGKFTTSATGIVVAKKVRATVRGGSVTGNRDAGVFADAGATLEVARTAFGGNGGAGLDLSPGGVTPNSKKKTANRNVGWPKDLVFDEETGRVTGKSEPGARIDAYAVEEGARDGNPANGEGVLWLGETIAAADGTFSFPDAGRAPCPPSKTLTFTATRLPGDGITFNARIETSEFSDDVECKGGPEIVLVSQNSAGVPGDQPLYDIAPAGLRSRNVSDDGRVVVFESKATNLVAGDTNGLIDVFLRDTVAGTTIRVSRTAAGGQIEPSVGVNSEAAYGPSLSSDGRFVVYETRSDSVSGEDGSNPAVILFDAQTGVNTVVASAKGQTVPYPSGRFSLYDGRGGAISGDGNVVAFSSLGADWVPGDAGDDYDMFVWTRASGAYERITVTSAGGDPQGGSNPANCGHPRLSHDGRFVAFYSNHDLIGGGPPGPNVGVVRVWLRDRQAGTTEVVSLTETGALSFGFDPWVSDDGRFVAFSSTAAFVAADTNGVEDIYLRDRQTGATTRVSLDAAGAQRVSRSHSPAMSGDGRFITFLSIGSYTFPGGGTVGNINDLFLVDREAATVVEAGVGPSGEALGGCFSPRLSRTGSFLYFDTAASNLVDLGGQTFVNHGYLRALGQ